MKKHYLVLLFLVFFSSSLNAEGNIEDEYEILKSAFFNQDKLKLEQFFNNWHKKSKSLEKIDYSDFPDIEKYVYHLFSDFYFPRGMSLKEIPKDLKETYKDPDTLKALFLPYREVEYIIIQNTIYYGVADNFFDIIGKIEVEINNNYLSISDSITSFYPPIKIRDKKILYLTDEYAEILYSFVFKTMEDSMMSGESGEEAYKNYISELDRRADFLRPKIAVLPGHWGGMHILTMPIVNKVIFDKRIRFAKILLRNTWFSGAESYFFRIGNKWFKIAESDTWME